MKISEYISGKYEQQYEYKSFLPERINHAWHVDEPELVTLLDHSHHDHSGKPAYGKGTRSEAGYS